MNELLAIGIKFYVEMLDDQIKEHEGKIARLKKLRSMIQKILPTMKAAELKSHRESEKLMRAFQKQQKKRPSHPPFVTGIGIQ